MLSSLVECYFVHWILHRLITSNQQCLVFPLLRCFSSISHLSFFVSRSRFHPIEVPFMESSLTVIGISFIHFITLYTVSSIYTSIRLKHFPLTPTLFLITSIAASPRCSYSSAAPPPSTITSSPPSPTSNSAPVTTTRTPSSCPVNSHTLLSAAALSKPLRPKAEEALYPVSPPPTSPHYHLYNPTSLAFLTPSLSPLPPSTLLPLSPSIATPPTYPTPSPSSVHSSAP